MREAFKDFQNEYFGDDVSMEFKNFNVVHIVAIAALLFSIILVMLFFPTRKAVLVCFCTAAVALFTLYEGNRTGNYIACSMVMSCVINLLFFPMIFFEYGKINSGIAIYFILGLLYNVVLMPPIRAFIMCGIDFVTYFIIIDVGANIFPDTRLTGETIYDYLNIAIGIILTSISCGLVIKYKVHLYNNVQNNLEKIHEEAMETYVAKDIFLINMSHEIRTPMNAIVGTVDLLLDQDVNDHVRECVYNILNSCNALLSLTDEVMDISKSTTSEIEIHNHKYDVSDMLMEIINMMAVRLMDSDIEFKVDIDNQLPLNLYGDGSRLKQVFNNLLSNAVKYTKEGSITLRVGCEYLSDTEVMIKGEVEDTGIGIKEDAVPGLFDVYKRVQDSKHNVEKIEGTGLGLPICKDIVEKMYGNIQVESVYNQGSRFSFEVLQTVESGKRIVELEAANRFKALIYTSKSDETEQIKNILDLLNVSNTIIEDDEKFEKSLNVCLYNYIFISADYYKANESVLFHQTLKYI